ncbi:hypothetical protein [Yoonia sp. F2084L]|uniref:hypothetical protein n=1 Tax=Yoonia sp. F2084L TaxID=2926419 RepID=UPI001FF3730E|nr:hypothetical protein [Yoonia sp. F2084L]
MKKLGFQAPTYAAGCLPRERRLIGLLVSWVPKKATSQGAAKEIQAAASIMDILPQ